MTGRPGWPRRATARQASSPPAELAGDAGALVPVWIAVGRAGVTAHKIAPVDGDRQWTVCRRIVRNHDREHGQTLAAAVVAERYRAAWCPRCWPQQTETTREARR